MSDQVQEPEAQEVTFSEVVLGETYQDTLGESIKGVCISIRYHLSQCTTVQLFSDHYNPVTYELVVQRLKGYNGDPSNHPEEARRFLGKKVVYEALGVAGVCVGYSVNMHTADRVIFDYVNSIGNIEGLDVDAHMMELIEPEVQAETKSTASAKSKTKVRAEKTGPGSMQSGVPLMKF